MTQVAPQSGRRTQRGAADSESASNVATQSASGPAASGPAASGSAGASPNLVDDPGTPPTQGRSLQALQDEQLDSRGRHATPQGQNFANIVGWTVLGSLIPGTGLIAAGRRTLGGVVLVITALLGSAAISYAFFADPVAQVTAMASNPNDFVIIAGVLTVLVVVWAAIVVGTHASLRRYANLDLMQKVLCALLVTSLIGIVAIPTIKAGSYALIARDALQKIFSDTESPVAGAGPRPNVQNAVDPWAGIPRVNVLLIGSDAGADRTGIRPDTMIVASIDTHTGRTVLFSLPRNLQHVPFPPGTQQAADYPNGYYCTNPQGVNVDCLLNGFWTFGVNYWKQYYPQAKSSYQAGLTATEQAAEQVTGLRIDRYAMLNLDGFKQFVNALGGVRVNVTERLPIGGSSENPVAEGGWIEKGNNQLLNGYHALWFARSRWSTSDYSRMQRQRCVIAAVVSQADPTKVALAFPEIAAAAKSNVTTDIPLKDLSAWVTLALRVKKSKVTSLPFTDAVVDTSYPNFDKIRKLVQESINPPAPRAATPSPSSTKKSTAKASPAPIDQRKAQDVTQVC